MFTSESMVVAPMAKNVLAMSGLFSIVTRSESCSGLRNSCTDSINARASAGVCARNSGQPGNAGSKTMTPFCATRPTRPGTSIARATRPAGSSSARSISGPRAGSSASTWIGSRGNSSIDDHGTCSDSVGYWISIPQRR